MQFNEKYYPYYSCAVCGAEELEDEPVCESCGALHPTITMTAVRDVVVEEREQAAVKGGYIYRSYWLQHAGSTTITGAVMPVDTHAVKPEQLKYARLNPRYKRGGWEAIDNMPVIESDPMQGDDLDSVVCEDEELRERQEWYSPTPLPTSPTVNMVGAVMVGLAIVGSAVVAHYWLM